MRLVEVGLGLGSLAFGVGAMALPDAFARHGGTPRSAARPMAVRDLAVGALLLARGGRRALVARGLSDVLDAALSVRRKPWVAVLASSSAAVALGTAAVARPEG